MGDDIARTYPGQDDISNQFSSGPNIRKTLARLKHRLRHGGYHFGDLTTKILPEMPCGLENEVSRLRGPAGHTVG